MLAIVLFVIRAVTCRRGAKFCTSVVQVSHGSAIILQDLSGGEVFGLDDPLLRLVSSLIHDFLRIAPNRKPEANFRHPSFFYVFLRPLGRIAFSASRETFRIASVCGYGNASTSLNVRFHYHITTNHSCDKSTKFEKNASMDNIHLSKVSCYRFFTESSWIIRN